MAGDSVPVKTTAQHTSAEYASPLSPRKRALLAAAVILVSSLGYYVGTALPVFRDALISYFQLSEHQYGLLISCGSIPGAIGALLSGFLVDRYGPRMLLRIALAGLGAGMILAALGANFTLMVAAIMCSSLFNGGLYLIVQSYLIRLYPENRRRVLSVQLVCVSIAAIAFSIAAEQLLQWKSHAPQVTFGQVLHLPFAVMIVPVLLGAFLFNRNGSTAAGNHPVDHAPQPGEKWYRVSFTPAAWWLIWLMILHGTADAVSSLWMPRLLGSTANYAAVTFKPGYVMAAMGGVYVVSRALLAMIPDRVGRRSMLVFPGILGGGLFLISLFTRNQALVSGGYVLSAFLWSVEYPALLAMLAETEKRRYASAVAISLLVSGLLTTALSYAIGWMGDLLGESRLWTTMLLPAGMYVLVGIGGTLYLLTHHKKTPGTAGVPPAPSDNR